ncbi:MAG TPA: hypothetical protein VFV67_26755 [Actinophytocola sp.]|uniref:hypothetical protein n=1 Tax=Actinophytocola sp. TaxID=1872138 RepID=UPI002DBA7573|nr:hypothetical protein [Actinophytocola sp.]HEU5474264.1 hypothetical protein [Actinophytocola sp.]
MEFRTRPDGTKYPLAGGGGKGGGKGGGGAVLAVLAAVALAGGGGAVGAGGLGASGGGGTAAGSVPGNLSRDVVDSLPGRDLSTRRAEGRKSARQGRANEAWSRVKFKELNRKIETGVACVASATGRVRQFLTRTPCTSLAGMMLLVGDGQGNAAVVSVVRIGFRTAAQASAFQEVEDVGGSGDVRPLPVSAVLDLAGVEITGQHYHIRRDGAAARVIGEADVATGTIDREVLLALADIGSYLPIR